MTDSQENGVLETAQKLLEQHVLCDRCLGRQFGWLSTNTTNDARGYSLKLTLSMIADEQLKSGNRKHGTKSIQVLAGNGMFDSARRIADKNSIDYETLNVCHLCSIEDESVFDRIPMIAERMVGLATDFEFETFLVGSNPVPSLVERQDELSGIHSILHAETLKSHFNRELGTTLHGLIQKGLDWTSVQQTTVSVVQPQSDRQQQMPHFRHR